MKQKTRVLIAGIGGASLGTELYKSLRLAGEYTIFGCDISQTAFGLYEEDFESTWLVSQENYLDDVVNICETEKIDVVVPGGESPNTILAASSEVFTDRGILLVANDKSIVNNFGDKANCFKILSDKGLKIPWTFVISEPNDLDHLVYPCILKPSKGSGGSANVYLALNYSEASLYYNLIRANGKETIAQEYISDKEGEFTVGVLTNKLGEIIGSIALKRLLDSKLSTSFSNGTQIVSSGYSQGLIEDFPEVCMQAEIISTKIGSRGPLNIQGRVVNGELIPFEINPRLSASTFLRSMAGFNEIDLFIRSELKKEGRIQISIRKGLYLRSFTEKFVELGNLK